MFIGEHSHSIDSKGRVSIPAKYREELAEGVVITRGLDRCLWVYPSKQWATIAEKIARLPISQKASRAFARLMLAGAWDTELDSQGRINVPEYLRNYSSVNKHVIVAGLFDRLEIWDEDKWHNYREETEAAGDQIAEGMADLGI